MSTLETRIAETLAAHWSASTHTDCEPFVDKCDGCGEVVRTWGEQHGAWVDSPLVSHQATMLAPVIREAQAEALKAEATNLRELHTLIEDTPWNPMPAEDKARCTEFMAESGVDDHEYTDRHLNNYAAWLDHRAEQIRSNDE